MQGALVLLAACVAAQANDTLVYSYCFFRHGIRAPLYKPYPTDPYKTEYHTYFPGGPGEFTQVGKQQVYRVGQELRRRYEQLISDYTEEAVHVSSTNTSRTMMTALTTMAAMFPPDQLLFSDLRWQPIPVWQNTDDFDKAFIFNYEKYPELAIQDCPRYGQLVLEGFNISLRPDLTPGRKQMYELLQKYTGDPSINSVDAIGGVYDTLQFESLNGLPLPSWATQPQPYYQNRPLYPDVMRPVAVEWYLDNQYLDNNKEMLQLYAGPLFNNIQEHLKKKADNPQSPERLRYHATHDNTLFALLWALRLRQPQAVGPGDGLLFELHLSRGVPTVKMYYYNARDHSVQEVVSPMCPLPCLLDQFIEVTPSLTSRQWKDKCQQQICS